MGAESFKACSLFIAFVGPEFGMNMNVIFLMVASLTLVSAHGDHCRCGASQQVCRKHQWMLLAMLGMFLSYAYMYAGYYWASLRAWCSRDIQIEEEEDLDLAMEVAQEHVKTCNDANCAHCEAFNI